MKKKILLIALMVALFVCLFVISASAENKVIKLTECPTLEQIHANPSAYVSHLDAFDTNSYKEENADSVVVMSDLQATPTYYVFPTFYILRSYAYTTNVTSLNEALVSYNASLSEGEEPVFATYTASGGRGANVHTVRIEIPTYVTRLDGYNKFEGSTNLIEVYFPVKTVIDEETGLEKTITCVTSIANQNIFTNCSSLKVIHNSKYLPVGIVNPAGFSECSSLETIELPAGITSFSDYLFDGCTSLKSITIPYGVTSVGIRAFRNCKSLKSITFPNSVQSIGKGLFVGCTALETVNLGAGVTTLSGSDNNMEIFTSGNTSLKYVYMPATFGSILGNASKNHNSMFSHGNITIFFTGNEDDYQRIAEMASKYAENASFTGALVEKYDPTINYEGYATSKGKSVVAWGYSECKAFYNNEHELEQTTKVSVDSYIKGFDELCHCTRCNEDTKVNEETYAPIFEFLGYSASMASNQICSGYTFDKTSYDAYVRITGKTISFGVVGIIPPESADMTTFEPVNTDLTPYDEYTILANVTDEYASFDFIITGFSAEYYDVALIMCAFVCDGANVDYISSVDGETVQTEYASTITFNSKLQA